MKKRFKTKQELGGRDVEFEWGEPCKYPGSYHPSATTTSPHPYEGKSFKIRVTENDTLMVQKKAFALGCGWNGHNGSESEKPNTVSLFIRLSNSDIAFMENDNMSYFQNHHGIELTPQQFMDGDLPAMSFDGKADWTNMSGWEAGSMKSDEGEKTDAFVIEAKDNCVYLWTKANKRLKESPGSLYMYNLIHANEFFTKYPEKPKLKFREWEVKGDMNYVKVGCVKAEREHVNSFCQIMRLLMKHDIGPRNMYSFLNSNRKELDLNF